MGKPTEGMRVRAPGRAKAYTVEECEVVATTHVMDEYHRECMMYLLTLRMEQEYSKAGGIKGELRGLGKRLDEILEVVKNGKARQAEGDGTECEVPHSAEGVGGGVGGGGGGGEGVVSGGGDAVNSAGGIHGSDGAAGGEGF